MAWVVETGETQGTNEKWRHPSSVHSDVSCATSAADFLARSLALTLVPGTLNGLRWTTGDRWVEVRQVADDDPIVTQHRSDLARVEKHRQAIHTVLKVIEFRLQQSRDKMHDRSNQASVMAEKVTRDPKKYYNAQCLAVILECGEAGGRAKEAAEILALITQALQDKPEKLGEAPKLVLPS